MAKPIAKKPWTIFLSHSSKDKPFADWLYAKLRSADLTVWYDKYEILVGDSIVKKIAEGIEGCKFLIIIISPRAMKSNWVKAELEPKILEQIEEAKITVLPIVLGKIVPGEVSPFLKGKKWIKFPYEGSDEKFRELLEGIEVYLEKRGLLKASPRIEKNPGQTRFRNPFGLRGGVDPERYIVSKHLISEVTEDIAKKQSLSIVGVRMIGKTSLLKFLTSKQWQTLYVDENNQWRSIRPIYFDLQEHTAKSSDQLVPNLAWEISKLLPAKQRFQGHTHEQALEWIKQTAGKTSTNAPLWLMLFDEFDRIVEMSGLDRILFDQLRSLSEHYNICFVIASRKKLIEMPLPHGVTTSPFFNIFKMHTLEVWDNTTTQTLMRSPLGKTLNLFTGDDIAFITQLTARHPLLLQKIGCYHLFKARCTNGKKLLNYDHVQESYIQEAEDVYRYYWNYELTTDQHAWLKDCWQVLSQNDAAALLQLQKNSSKGINHTLRVRLAKLGFVLTKSGPIELPTGLQLFLEEI